MHAVDVEGVVLRALAGDAGAGALANAAGRSHARAEQAEIIDARPVDHSWRNRPWHIDGLPGVERGLQLRRGGIDGGRGGRYLNGGGDRSHLQA